MGFEVQAKKDKVVIELDGLYLQHLIMAMQKEVWEWKKLMANSYDKKASQEFFNRISEIENKLKLGYLEYTGHPF